MVTLLRRASGNVWGLVWPQTYFCLAQKITRRQARLALYLMRFNYTLHHKPGKTIVAEDSLPRRSDHEEGVNLNNCDQILLKPEHFVILALEATHDLLVDNNQLFWEVKSALLSNKVTKDYKSLLKSGLREFGKSLIDWNYENGLLLYQGKVYIPESNGDL